MYIVFFVIQAFGLGYFGLTKRTFDLLAAAFLSSCVYFLPGHFGYVLYPTPQTLVESSLLEETYLVMSLVMIAPLIGAILLDYRQRRAPRETADAPTGYAPIGIMVVLTVLGLLGTLTGGVDVVGSPKAELLRSLDRWYALWGTTAVVGFVFSVDQRRKIETIFFSSVLLFDMYLGFRVNAAIAFLSMMALILGRKGSQRVVLTNWRQIAGGIVVCYLFFLFASIAWALRAHDFQLLADVLREGETYYKCLTQSEPFITQAILNAVIEFDYKVSAAHLGTAVIVMLVPFAPEIGFLPVSFNDLFQEALFPGLSFGMANNIWAEMWSGGGWVLLGVFVAVYTGLHIFLSSGALNRSRNVQVIVVITGILWGFYVHRNDLVYQVTMQRRLLVLWAVAVGIPIMVQTMMRRIRAQQGLDPREGSVKVGSPGGPGL